MLAGKGASRAGEGNTYSCISWDVITAHIKAWSTYIGLH